MSLSVKHGFNNKSIDQYFRNVENHRWKYVGYQYWYNVGNWCCTNSVHRYDFDCPLTVAFRQSKVGIQRWIDVCLIVNFCLGFDRTLFGCGIFEIQRTHFGCRIIDIRLMADRIEKIRSNNEVGRIEFATFDLTEYTRLSCTTSLKDFAFQ